MIVKLNKKHRKILNLLNKYKKVKIRLYDYGEIDRERIIFKNGGCIVRYHHHDEDKFSRYSTSCFAEDAPYDRLDKDNKKNVLMHMQYHDYGSLSVREVMVGPGFKRTIHLNKKKKKKKGY